MTVPESRPARSELFWAMVTEDDDQKRTALRRAWIEQTKRDARAHVADLRRRHA